MFLLSLVPSVFACPATFATGFVALIGSPGTFFTGFATSAGLLGAFFTGFASSELSFMNFVSYSHDTKFINKSFVMCVIGE